MIQNRFDRNDPVASCQFYFPKDEVLYLSIDQLNMPLGLKEKNLEIVKSIISDPENALVRGNIQFDLIQLRKLFPDEPVVGIPISSASEQ